MARLAESDYRKVLDVLRAAGDISGPTPFPESVLEALRRLVPGAQLVEIANVAVCGGATAAVASRVGRPEPERFQDREAGILDALVVVRDREVADVVYLPRGYETATGLDHGVRSRNAAARSGAAPRLRSAAPGPRSRP